MNGFIKICGITDAFGMDAALRHGADMIGFVFREASSRNISMDAARQLGAKAKGRAQISAVIVNPDDEFLQKLIATANPDILQLHGSETPRRVADIAARFQKPVVKALGLASKEDLAALKRYESLCMNILVEARTAEGLAAGGHGRVFDWTLLNDLARRDHLLLAGGLNAENIGEAIAVSRAGGVDVSSGVESAPGIKDDAKIGAFISAARTAYAATSVTRVRA